MNGMGYRARVMGRVIPMVDRSRREPERRFIRSNSFRSSHIWGSPIFWTSGHCFQIYPDADRHGRIALLFGRCHLLTLTTVRPRTWPFIRPPAAATTSFRPISTAVFSRSISVSKEARRSQASTRSAFGRVTLLMPNSATPRRMKGATLAGKSNPCAMPHAATAPSALIPAQTLASVWLPTESIAAIHRSFCSGLPGCDNCDRSMISAAPRLLR